MTASNPPDVSSNPPADPHALYEAGLALHARGLHAEAVTALNLAAQGGHVPAMSLLGAQVFSGRGAPPDPVAGVGLIMAAAELGGGYACAMAAALVASGLSGAQDWPRALDYLQRAAELGYPPAQDQLRLLARAFGPVAARDGDWAKLRRAVSLKAWRTPPAPRILRDDPPMRVFDALLPPAVCDWIIGRGKERLRPARIYDAQSGGPTADGSRRNSAAELALADMDMVLLMVRERIGAAIGLPVATMEGPQVLHYAVGERFTPHYDFLDLEFEGHARALAEHGQRVATVLVYLNDEGLEGGETDFPVLGVRHRGGRGDALLFANVDADGLPDRRSLHAGLPPTAGEKWLFSQWIRDRAPPGVGDPRMAAAMRGY
jgi:hypothetical protein